MDVGLDDRAGVAPGQPIDLPAGPASDVRVEITGVDGLGIPGIAEVGLGGPIIDEALRIPTDLTHRMDIHDDSPLVVLLNREKGDRSQPRAPDEVEIDRFVDLPRTADFSVSGSVLTDPGATPEAFCTDPVLTVDGRHVPVRTERRPDGSTALIGCEPVRIPAGEHRISTQRIGAGRVVVDQLVLQTAAIDPGVPAQSASLQLAVDDSRHLSGTVPPGSGRFWLVLSESQNRGWQLDTHGGRLLATAMVDGYANGWLIEPDGSGATDVSLVWTPQRIVWTGFAISALAVILALGVLARRRHLATSADLVELTQPVPESSARLHPCGSVVTTITCLGFLFLTWFVSDLSVVAVAALALALRLTSRAHTVPMAGAAAAAVVAAEMFSRPSLVFAGLAILGSTLIIDRLRPQGVTDTRRSVPG